MAVITSDPFLLGDNSFVTKTDGNTSVVTRISKGKALTETEIEEAGDFYNKALGEIDYAEIYNLDFGANFLSKKGASDEWMGTALTDPMYKDAFKKATGKNSANISFISPETLSSFAAPANNTDANGKSNLSKGGSILRYPKNVDKKNYDFLKVCAYEYKPRNFDTSSGNSLTGDYEKREAANTVRKAKGAHTVYLPMEPQGLAEGNTANWNEDKMNAITAGFAAMAGGAVEGAEDGMAAAAQKFAQASGETAKTLKDALKGDQVAAYFAGKAVGNEGVFTRATGKVMNNNLELLFSGPSLRTFNYNFRFTPRDKSEANEIKRIIKFFKKAMAPIRSEKKMFLESPHVFKLKYIFKNGDQHPFLNKIKTCACTNFSVQYAPDGSYMTYDDGSMTSYTVSLSFGELNPIYNEDIDESSNDMGY